MSSLVVRVDGDERCFHLPAWRELLARDPNRHIFMTPEWNRVWWEEFSSGKDLLLLVMRRQDRIAAIVPLYRKPESGAHVLRFLGGIDLTDYLGPICSSDDRDAVAEALASWLADADVAWDELDAHSMPVPLGFADFLVDHVDRSGLEFRLEQEETSAILPLPADWASYLSELGSKERHELKRKQRRLYREHPDARVRSSTEETLERDLKYFIEMHRGAEGHKGHFMRPDIATFFERMAREFMPLGWLRLHLLEVADRPIASTFGFEYEETFYLYNSAYEPDAGRLSPGFVLAADLVAMAIKRGLKFFDFLRGPERYKFQLGAQPVPLNNLRVWRKGGGSGEPLGGSSAGRFPRSESEDPFREHRSEKDQSAS
jgi:CelD/BcsL family acetyltransferase involved in cellulose biosynthesis